MRATEIVDYLNEIIPDPKCELNYNKDYELVIATMLSAQTTDKRVNEITKILFNKYPSLNDLNNADLDDLKRIIRPLGSYNKKASNIIDIASKLDKIGFVPNDRIFLESLNGVGRKTANVVLGELFHENVVAVDTHVERVSKRLGIANDNDSVLDVEVKLNKFFKGYDLFKIHHQLLLFGRYHCTARSPKCRECKFKCGNRN